MLDVKKGPETPNPLDRVLTMSRATLGEILDKATARTAKAAKAEIVATTKRIAEVEAELQRVRDKHIAILEQRLAQLKQ